MHTREQWVSGEAWSNVQRISPSAQCLAVCLSCPTHILLHAQAPFSGLLSPRIVWLKMKAVVTYFTSSHQLQWKKDQNSNKSYDKDKATLKKKIFFLIQQTFPYISSIGLCAPIWTNFPGRRLDQIYWHNPETRVEPTPPKWRRGDFHREPMSTCVKK